MFQLVFVLVSCAFIVHADRRPSPEEYCPLCDYVYFDDGFYSYSYMSQYNRSEDLGIPVTTYMLNMTSQKWKDESWTDKPVWFHYLFINVPNEILYPEHGFIQIDGSSNSDDEPPPWDKNRNVATALLADSMKLVTGIVYYIPNQPLVYTPDPDQQPRYEDDSIAYTWRYFMNQERDNPPGDPEVLLRWPMCKGAIKAMDTVQSFANVDLGVSNITKFFMAGLSKRGWTTWLSAPIDDRVIGMAPTVLTSLNLHPIFHHYYQSFDGWPLYFYDYWSKGLMGRIDSPEMEAMKALVDPYSYRQWMNFPKLIVAGASDEFFLLDDSYYFFDNLPGQKHLWLIEDSGHSIDDSPSAETYWEMLATFYLAIINNYQRPVFDWIIDSPPGRNGTASIRVFTDETPAEIVAYSALSVVPERRDWRLLVRCEDEEDCSTKDTNITWARKEVEDVGAGQYSVEYAAPGEGFLAFFIKLVYTTPYTDRNFTFSTEVAIAPNYFPYEDCSGIQCTGRLK